MTLSSSFYQCLGQLTPEMAREQIVGRHHGSQDPLLTYTRAQLLEQGLHNTGTLLGRRCVQENFSDSSELLLCGMREVE